MRITDEMLSKQKSNEELENQRIDEYIGYLQGKTFKQLNLYDLSYLYNHFPTIYKKVMDNKKYKIEDMKYWFELQKRNDLTIGKDISR